MAEAMAVAGEMMDLSGAALREKPAERFAARAIAKALFRSAESG
jgi:hypothetical protein